jgi:hypothetical protein
VTGQPCLICSEPIKPEEPVSFQEGGLVHTTCYNERSKFARRRKQITYNGHTLHIFCYPLMGRWQPVAIVKSPGRLRATRLGRMELRDTAQEALACALKAATDWIRQERSQRKAD